MDKVIELAREAGIVFPETQEDSFTCWIEELTQFYTLARADLEAENAKLKGHIKHIGNDALRAENARLKQECAARDQAGYLRGLEDAKRVCEEVDSDSGGEKYDMFGNNLAAQCVDAIDKLKEQP